MNTEKLEYFRGILQEEKRSLLEEAGKTVSEMTSDTTNFPDPTDRATQESDRSFELRIRDRERRLINKIQEALAERHGFHRCRCGVTAATKAGLPLNYNGYNLKRAVEFKWALPPTTIHVGAIGYVPHGGPSGHVFTVVHYSGGSTATVYDDKGTYERNISGATFVDPNGNTAYSARGKPQKMAAVQAVSYSHGSIGQ